mmetsp:Transcript_43580/g.92730  ORF Transcript_43580/g.92730 Transcript_43580/m.92730 type:complete len:209 (+) Transcript_43580:21-647(+)
MPTWKPCLMRTTIRKLRRSTSWRLPRLLRTNRLCSMPGSSRTPCAFGRCRSAIATITATIGGPIRARPRRCASGRSPSRRDMAITITTSTTCTASTRTNSTTDPSSNSITPTHASTARMTRMRMTRTRRTRRRRRRLRRPRRCASRRSRPSRKLMWSRNRRCGTSWSMETASREAQRARLSPPPPRSKRVLPMAPRCRLVHPRRTLPS